MTKTILITGSGGFVGKNLKEYLKDKYSLFCPRSFELDLLDKTELNEYFKVNKIDFVIHCANKGGARGIVDDESVINDNLKMFNNLVNCIGNNNMIFFGSGAQYNKFQPLCKIKEEDIGKSIPQDPYGHSKYLITKQIEKLNNVLCLNIFGSYGKYEKENRFPSYAISQNLKKEPIIINQNVIFDYLYIDDLCKIVEHFIGNKPKRKFLNITPTESIDLINIAKMVNEISDFQSEIIIKNNELNYEYTGSNNLLLKEIKDLTFTSYQNGLTSLFEHLKEQLISQV